MGERWRVDFEYGYISLDISEKEKAWELYRERGIRIRRCRDLFDDGVVVAGKPLVVDLTRSELSN
jgi:hypothetical protein